MNLKVAFPRDGTFRCPFVPGQGHFPCPGVPLSRDKGKIKCPGTNSSVPVRPGTKLGENRGKTRENRGKPFFFKVFLFFSSVRGTGQPVKIRPVPCPVPDCQNPACHVPRPVPDFDPIPLSLCPRTMMELLYLCLKKLHCPVPLETLV